MKIGLDSLGFGKVVSVRGSGDKAIRRQDAVDWVKMGEQNVAEWTVKVCFSLLSTFGWWLLNYNRESDIIKDCTQIYSSVYRKNETLSQQFGHSGSYGQICC